jgi:hypothetical protein
MIMRTESEKKGEKIVELIKRKKELLENRIRIH